MTAHPLTANEVSALTGLDESRVRKEVEHGVFSTPSFAFADLVYFALLDLLGLRLGVDDRKKLHDAIASAVGSRRHRATAALSPVLELKLEGVTKDVEGRLARFEAWKTKRVVVDPGVLSGEPTFSGTRLAVRHVGEMLLAGTTPEEIREDYPYLTNEDVELSPVFTKAYPRTGRPRERQPAPR